MWIHTDRYLIFSTNPDTHSNSAISWWCTQVQVHDTAVSILYAGLDLNGGLPITLTNHRSKHKMYLHLIHSKIVNNQGCEGITLIIPSSLYVQHIVYRLSQPASTLRAAASWWLRTINVIWEARLYSWERTLFLIHPSTRRVSSTAYTVHTTYYMSIRWRTKIIA